MQLATACSILGPFGIKAEAAEMTTPRHLVQFYEDEVFLSEAVASFVKVGLQVNDTLIIIATPSHCRDVCNLLTPDELANSKIMFFDAASLLTNIMVDDCPNEYRFTEIIGNLIQKAGQRGRVRVFGEMVSLLWAEGKYQAALRLEELWDEFQTKQPVFRMCAHPHSALTSKEHPRALNKTYSEVRYQKPSKPSPVIDRTRDIFAALVFLCSALSERVPASYSALLE
jgi:MEDS: MEthanogen/methylotroph, DcmR Sensory domain